MGSHREKESGQNEGHITRTTASRRRGKQEAQNEKAGRAGGSSSSSDTVASAHVLARGRAPVFVLRRREEEGREAR